LYYYSIEKSAIAEYKDKGSRFIAYSYPFKDKEELKKMLGLMKKEHPKASHFCFAYKIGTDGNNFRANDDGEPSGSAGKPILNAIESKQLTNVLVVVVRYFGGTLLGVPGLIHAYRTAAIMSLQLVPTIQYQMEEAYQLQFDHTILNDVMQLIKQFNCTIIKQENQLFYLVQIGIPKARLEELLHKFKELYTLDVVKM
jgi:uncharacterized YigZ family protein